MQYQLYIKLILIIAMKIHHQEVFEVSNNSRLSHEVVEIFNSLEPEQIRKISQWLNIAKWDKQSMKNKVNRLKNNSFG